VDLYMRLTTGAPGTMSIFTEPADVPGTGTMYTLDDVMGVAPTTDQSSGATAADVLDGSTFWGLTGGEWGLQTGTMQNNSAISTIVPTTTPQNIPAGYHNGSGMVAGDAYLVGENIKSGVSIFGVPGSASSCTGTTGVNGNCSGTCNCQAGLVCVNLRADSADTVWDTFGECVLAIYPPPGLPLPQQVCLNWASATATISANGACIGSFQNSLNPYAYITPVH
jgi:hypothetical protein